ncbi:MAG: hypothetical protein F6K11_28335 [Leptolyngbya sp. SIO3F4]|nr:hypothetical protein [Leptolyngbya sp. SIO3F4]
MRKQDIKKDASGTSMLLSAVAFMLSALAMLAYFMFKSVSQPQTAKLVATTESSCQTNFDNKEALFEGLSDLKTKLGDKWSSSCQDRLDSSLYDTAIIKAAEGQFSTSFTRLCQISERSGSDYFEEAKFLFSLWEQNRNTSGKNQEIKPLLESFFQTYNNPKENCPAANKILDQLSP